MPGGSFDSTTLIPALDALPGPWGLLAVLLYLSFVLHLLLVNAVLGVSAITLADRLYAGADPFLRADLRDQSSLLPKGVALVVNFAIPPFLFLQGIYGQFIYSGSILGALWWLSLMAAVMLAYYGLYISMAQGGLSERTRTFSLALSLVLLLWAAFLLVNNSTLIQNPERWTIYGQNANGLYLNLGDPQMIPRYLHVLLSCLAVGGLCLALAARYRSRRLGGEAPESERFYLQKREARSLACFFYATLAQIPVGGWFFLSLPQTQRRLFMAGDPAATPLFFAALFLVGWALLAARRGRTLAAALSALAVIFFMSGLRFILRASLIDPYYKPLMRPAEWGPLLLFLGALAVSVPLIMYLVAVYRRQAMLPVIEDRAEDTTAHEAEPVAPRQGRGDAPAREHDLVLVNEIALGRADRDERAGAPAGPEPDARPLGGKRP